MLEPTRRQIISARPAEGRRSSDDPIRDTALICAYTCCPGTKLKTRCAHRVIRTKVLQFELRGDPLVIQISGAPRQRLNVAINSLRVSYCVRRRAGLGGASMPPQQGDVDAEAIEPFSWLRAARQTCPVQSGASHGPTKVHFTAMGVE